MSWFEEETSLARLTLLKCISKFNYSRGEFLYVGSCQNVVDLLFPTDISKNLSSQFKGDVTRDDSQRRFLV